MNIKKKVFSIRLSNIDFEYLDDIGGYLGLNRSNTIRALVHNYYKRKLITDNDYKKPSF